MSIKYPRTYHLPYSLGKTNDDKVISDINIFKNIPLIMTIKMDGENCTMTRDSIYARSIDSNNHPSRDWVKSLWSVVRYNIPKGWRICGENLYAKHSISYNELKSYYLVFSIWDENNNCLSWNDTLEYCELLNLKTVDYINEVFSLDSLEFKHQDFINKYPNEEGYVIRNSNSFHYNDFSKNVAKYVRSNHVQTDEH